MGLGGDGEGVGAEGEGCVVACVGLIDAFSFSILFETRRGKGRNAWGNKPEIYWDRSSLPMWMPFLPLWEDGSQTAVMGRLWFGPGVTETSRAVAWPRTVLLTRMFMSMNGTVAEYSVGLVTLTFAPMVREVFEVS